MGSVKPTALIGPISLSTWAWIAAVTRGWAWPERRDRDAVREVEVGAPVRVVQAVPLAVAPVALEVAAQDGRQVRGEGRRSRRRRSRVGPSREYRFASRAPFDRRGAAG